jgi:hypothetical protein
MSRHKWARTRHIKVTTIQCFLCILWLIHLSSLGCVAILPLLIKFVMIMTIFVCMHAYDDHEHIWKLWTAIGNVWYFFNIFILIAYSWLLVIYYFDWFIHLFLRCAPLRPLLVKFVMLMTLFVCISCACVCTMIVNTYETLNYYRQCDIFFNLFTLIA